MRIIHKLKHITHEHRLSLGILLASGVLNLSFCIEKVLIHLGYYVSPLTWAIVFGSLSLIALIGAVVEFIYDLDIDCKGE